MRLTGYLNINNIWIIPTPRCSRCLQGDWTGVLLTDDKEHAIKLLSKGEISIWTDNDLKHIDHREPHQIGDSIQGSR